MDFLMRCILLNFLMQCSGETTITLSPFDQEAVLVNEDLKYTSNATGYLFEKLCSERVVHKKEVNKIRLAHKEEVDKIRLEGLKEHVRAEKAVDRAERYGGQMVKLQCGRDLRQRMETFGIELSVNARSIQFGSTPLKEAFRRMRIALTDRTNKIEACVAKLKYLYRQYDWTLSTDWDTKKPYWEAQVKTTYRDIKQINITAQAPKNLIAPMERNVTHLFVQFYTEENEDSAVSAFQKQCDAYYWSFLHIDFETCQKEYKALAIQMPEIERITLMKGCGTDTLSTSEEYKFLYDLFNTRTFFLSNQDRRHEKCAEVFYFSESTYLLPKVIDRLKKKWPDADFANMVNNFCSSFTAMYNVISVTRIYDSIIGSDIECKANSSHYYEYINNLSPLPDTREEFIFVATFLGAIEPGYKPE